MPTRSKAKQFRFPAPSADDAAISAEVEAANSYIEKIRSAYAKSAEGILETGRALVEAKANLSYGTFSTLVETKLPFSRQWAYKLMAIAESNRLANVKDTLQLPPRVETLYALTRLDDDQWKEAKKKGLIRQDVREKDVAALREKHATKKAVPAVSVAATPPSIDHLEARRKLDHAEFVAPIWDRLPKPRTKDASGNDTPTNSKGKYWWLSVTNIPYWEWDDEREWEEIGLHLSGAVLRAPDRHALDGVEIVLEMLLEKCRERRAALVTVMDADPEYRASSTCLRDSSVRPRTS